MSLCLSLPPLSLSLTCSHISCRFAQCRQGALSRSQTARGPHLLRPFCVETLDLYVSSPCAMGIISKSVAHACSGGARGLLRPNDQEYGKRQASSIFTAIKRNQGCTFQNPRNLICSGFCAKHTRTGQRRTVVATSTLSSPGFELRRRLSMRLKDACFNHPATEAYKKVKQK